MEAGPPKIDERVVGFFVPPACREHVLGDLHEHYTSRCAYALDALRTVPLVILSRVRRTTDPQVLLMEGFALYLSFLAAARQLDLPFLHEQSGLVKLAIPAAVALIALVLGDAYAREGKRSPVRPLVEAALGVTFAFLSQAALKATHGDWVVPHWIMLSGGGTSLLLVCGLRMLFPPDTRRPRGAS